MSQWGFLQKDRILGDYPSKYPEHTARFQTIAELRRASRAPTLSP